MCADCRTGRGRRALQARPRVHTALAAPGTRPDRRLLPRMGRLPPAVVRREKHRREWDGRRTDDHQLRVRRTGSRSERHRRLQARRPGGGLPAAVLVRPERQGHFRHARKSSARPLQSTAAAQVVVPDLKVVAAVGGWLGSTWFSDAAATAASRQAFVTSCLELLVDGDLPLVNGAGGPAAAAGIFDGFDLDWEYPVAGESRAHVTAATMAKTSRCSCRSSAASSPLVAGTMEAMTICC